MLDAVLQEGDRGPGQSGAAGGFRSQKIRAKFVGGEKSWDRAPWSPARGARASGNPGKRCDADRRNTAPRASNKCRPIDRCTRDSCVAGRWESDIERLLATVWRGMRSMARSASMAPAMERTSSGDGHQIRAPALPHRYCAGQGHFRLRCWKIEYRCRDGDGGIKKRVSGAVENEASRHRIAVGHAADYIQGGKIRHQISDASGEHPANAMRDRWRSRGDPRARLPITNRAKVKTADMSGVENEEKKSARAHTIRNCRTMKYSATRTQNRASGICGRHREEPGIRRAP